MFGMGDGEGLEGASRGRFRMGGLGGRLGVGVGKRLSSYSAGILDEAREEEKHMRKTLKQ